MRLDAARIAVSQRAVVACARACHPDRSIANFFAAIEALQPAAVDPAPACSRGTGRFVFDLDDPRAARVIGALRAAAPLDGGGAIGALAATDRAPAAARAAAGFAALQRWRPDLAAAFERLVSVVVVCVVPQLASGSHESALAAFWIAPTPRWTVADHARALAHETVHQFLFVEEMVHRLFVGDRAELAGVEASVRSPLRAEPRPYDVAFHAAFVAATLADLDVRAGWAPRDGAIQDRLQYALADLHAQRRRLTRRGQALLAELTARHLQAIAPW